MRGKDGESPSERALRARIAALHRLAEHGAERVVGSARSGFRESLLERVRASHPELPPSEQRRRADYLLREHMARMTLNSIRSRRAARSPERGH